ncbi:helix-turn-helix domain-containing protein [Parafrankia sp. BMG5.11]|uniref:helix-turn-helix domain-containing protein n=1 Tax=Parafrankia sp. BMG5.11 TaxID=222540 RepID=UPI00103EC796|nr:helix-turn-helix transcriptional regulator [Parafrankia sp. BMG5.11]TCJ32183.1 XRE family transcriptional regulator [Parafrankia sp. BMG5.11]
MKSEPGYLGSKLAKLRRESELSMAEVAERLGVSKPTVWAWENGKTLPRRDRMPAIAEALNIAESELILLNSGAEPLALNEALAEEIARSKARIAELAGTATEKVLIAITL